MRILLLATATNLPWVQAEVQRILRSGLIVTPLLGPITYMALMDEIIRSGADGLWVCGHMTEQGLDLGNEELLSAARLAPLLHRFRLIVLNTCSSLAVAQTLQRATDAEIIATISEVEDETAFGWGALFAQALARTGDPARADEEARAADDRNYVRLAGNFTMDNVTHDEYALLLAEMAETRKALAEVARMREALIGNKDYGLKGITGRLDEVCVEQQDVRQWLFWLTVAVVVSVALQIAQWIYLFFFV